LIDQWREKYDTLEEKYSDAIELIASNGFNSSSKVFKQMQENSRSPHDLVLTSLKKDMATSLAVPKIKADRRLSKLSKVSRSGLNSNRRPSAIPSRAPDELVKAPDIMKGNASLFTLLFRKLSLSDIV
jgi:hypothetical protein